MVENNKTKNAKQINDENITPDNDEVQTADQTEEIKAQSDEEVQQQNITGEESDSQIENEEAVEPEKAKDTEKKGFFKKEKKKDKKDELIEELTDKYKRTFAEFDNFRKRSEKEKSAMYEVGVKDVIEKILPVVDNFERGFKAVSEEEKATPFADGMDKIFKQLMKTLDDMGVKKIDAVGQTFDPDFHNAVMHIDDESFGENEVAEELQAGYTYRDLVVRHSMVKVAN